MTAEGEATGACASPLQPVLQRYRGILSPEHLGTS